MVVLSQVMVVELDEGLDGLLHGAHLDQSHLVVLPEGETRRLMRRPMFQGQDCGATEALWGKIRGYRTSRFQVRARRKTSE